MPADRRRVRYQANNSYSVDPNLSRHQGFGAFMLSSQARRPIVQAATNGLLTALRIAPRSDKAGDHYVDHFSVDAHSPPVLAPSKFGPNPHVGARIVNDSDHAAAAEFGNDHSKRHHRVLGRVGATMGDYRP